MLTKLYVKTTEAIRNFKEDQQAVTAIEYGLIALCITAFIIFVFYNKGGFVDVMKTKFSNLTSGISGISVSFKGQ